MNEELEHGLSQARQCFDRGELERAAELASSLMQRHPGSAHPCLAMAEIARARGQPSGQLDALREACRRDPDSIELTSFLGDACLAQARFPEAVAVYRGLRAREPQRLDWCVRLAAALQECGALDEAVALHREVLAAAPRDASAHYNLGTALKRQHDFTGAEAAYRRAIELAPEAAALRMSLASLLVETSRFEEAVPALEWVVAREPEARDAVHLLSYACKKLSRGSESVAAARRLVELSAGSADAQATLSAAFLAAGRPEDALAATERGLALDATNRNLLSDRCIALSGLGRTGAARALFDTDSLLSVEALSIPAGFTGIDDFNAALTRHVMEHPRLDFSGLSLSCHEGVTSDEIFVEPLGPLAPLGRAIREAAERYRERVRERAPGNPWCAALPDTRTLALSGWATRLRSQGFQHGHIHPTAWLSGVYYVSLPPEVVEDDDAGWIEFGRAPFFYAGGDQGEILPVCPRPGRLVLFPSYFYHRTIPFDSDRERLTIAFDLRAPGETPTAAG